jgi:hypothetical protein
VILGVREGWTDPEWDQFVAGIPAATFFHTRAWARLLVASFRSLRDQSIWFETTAGPCVLPLFAWRRGLGLLTTLHSSFPFLYGGPVHDGAADPEEILDAVLQRVGRPGASVRVYGNPLASRSSDAARRPAAPGGYTRHDEFTHLLALPPSEEAYWDGALTTAKRNDVRRLGKKGVAVEESRDPADADRVYGFYLDSFSRWGGRPGMVYPREFYRNLLHLGGDAVRLTVAKHEGKLLGGTFTVRWNGIVHYLAGYFDHASRALRPNVLIQVESILRAIQDRYRLYDFLPSGGHESVETFKEGFGGKRTPYPIFERTGPWHRLFGRGRPRAPQVEDA